MRLTFPSFAIMLILALVAFAQQDPWKDSDVIQPQALAARLTGASASKPVILYVGFPVLYRSSHIPDAILAGPVSKPEGLDALRQSSREAASQFRDRDLLRLLSFRP